MSKRRAKQRLSALPIISTPNDETGPPAWVLNETAEQAAAAGRVQWVEVRDCPSCGRGAPVDLATGALVCTYCRRAAETRAAGATPCKVCGAPVGPLEGFPLPDGARWDACPACKLAYYSEVGGMQRRRDERVKAAWNSVPRARTSTIVDPVTCAHDRVETRRSNEESVSFANGATLWSVRQLGYCQQCRWYVTRDGEAPIAPDGQIPAPRYEKWQAYEGGVDDWDRVTAENHRRARGHARPRRQQGG